MRNRWRFLLGYPSFVACTRRRAFAPSSDGLAGIFRKHRIESGTPDPGPGRRPSRPSWYCLERIGSPAALQPGCRRERRPGRQTLISQPASRGSIASKRQRTLALFCDCLRGRYLRQGESSPACCQIAGLNRLTRWLIGSEASECENVWKQRHTLSAALTPCHSPFCGQRKVLGPSLCAE